jgi:type I restriction enzyme M protein
MNLELHGVVADLAPHPGSALREDLHAGRQFDVIMTNPPFNISGWSNGDPASDPRWRYGTPPEGNANFAWLQHVVSCLAPEGRAAVVMANGALSSEHAQDRTIRAAMVEDGVVEALIALPPQLFSSTAVPVTVWLLRCPTAETDGEVLFVDAHALGGMVSRTQRILTQEDVRQITATYGAWRDRWSHGGYEDIRGFSASVTTQEIRAHDYRLTPSTYVGAPIATPKPAETALGLRRRLDRLRAHAIDVDAMAERQLNRIDAWTP